MLDLTPQLALIPQTRKVYRRLRFLLFSSFLVFSAYCAYRTAFPIRQYVLDPAKDDQTTSYVTATAGTGNFLIEVFSHKSFISDIDLQLRADDHELLDGKTVSVHKTYKAFAYPLSDRPAGFPDGTLAKRDEEYYLVYGGALRRFASKKAAQDLGYPVDSFIEAEASELSLHPLGQEIGPGEDYPDGTFFSIGGQDYWLRDGALRQFASHKTFLAYSQAEQSVKADTGLLKKYPVSPDRIGYPSGTLLGYAEGVFLVSDGKAMPFPEPLTFEAMGYDWNDVVPATGDEMAALVRESTFQLNRPHPDNTVFYDEDARLYYLIQGGRRLPISGQNILKAYLRRSPVTAQGSSLEQKADCKLESSRLLPNRLNCSFPVAALDRFAGNDFRFDIPAPENSTRSIRVTLRRQMNRSNLWLFLSDIKYKFRFRYGFLFQ